MVSFRCLYLPLSWLEETSCPSALIDALRESSIGLCSQAPALLLFFGPLKTNLISGLVFQS